MCEEINDAIGMCTSPLMLVIEWTYIFNLLEHILFDRSHLKLMGFTHCQILYKVEKE